jgi:replication-associated recombination protein RarA
MAYKQLLTVRKYDFYECASVIQKAIRRNEVAMAGYFALELFASGYANYCWKRLLTISAEDVHGIVTQEIKALYDAYEIINRGKTEPKGRIFISKAVIILCKAPKSRDADHLSNLIYDRRILVPDEEIEKWFDEVRKEPIDLPEYVYDVHTLKGKKMGRTKADFFISEQKALKPLQPGLFDNLADKF